MLTAEERALLLTAAPQRPENGKTNVTVLILILPFRQPTVTVHPMDTSILLVSSDIYTANFPIILLLLNIV